MSAVERVKQWPADAAPEAEAVLDEHTAHSASPRRLPEEELARASIYCILALLLAAPPSRSLIEVVGGLRGADSDFGRAVSALANHAKTVDVEAATREYHDLFVGVGEAEMVPYASYYLTGFLHEKPLARLRQDMRALGIEAAESVAEPEDGLATLCEIMAGLITGQFGGPAPLDRQRQFFEKHIGAWAPQFFTDLEHAPNADFYKRVGVVGQAFMAIEARAFSMDG